MSKRGNQEAEIARIKYAGTNAFPKRTKDRSVTSISQPRYAFIFPPKWYIRYIISTSHEDRFLSASQCGYDPDLMETFFPSMAFLSVAMCMLAYQS